MVQFTTLEGSGARSLVHHFVTGLHLVVTPEVSVHGLKFDCVMFTLISKFVSQLPKNTNEETFAFRVMENSLFFWFSTVTPVETQYADKESESLDIGSRSHVKKQIRNHRSQSESSRLARQPIEILDNHCDLGVRRRHLHGRHQPETEDKKRQFKMNEWMDVSCLVNE